MSEQLEINKIYNMDCLDGMKLLEDNSIDSIVTDPPYGLSFMGKKWDYDVPSVEIWQEALRVLKPGGHLLSFGGTRTYHRMACNIEDAGFEIRDMVSWIYGSGFPKSLNVGKEIDKLQGNEREQYRGKLDRDTRSVKFSGNAGIMCKLCGETTVLKETGDLRCGHPKDSGAISREAKQFEGYGTALKPACEPVCLARKPIENGFTVAENVLKWGTGAINIDGCRIEALDMGELEKARFNFEKNQTHKKTNTGQNFLASKELKATHNVGRFPANVMHDGSDEVVRLFPDSYGCQPHKINSKNDKYDGWGSITNKNGEMVGYSDSGSAARFFYCAKSSKAERNYGLDGFEKKRTFGLDKGDGLGRGISNSYIPNENFHPTVKPIKLMQYLCRLITPANGIVLDPFMGSGSTGIAAVLEGFGFIGIELDKNYFDIAQARIESYKKDKQLALI